MLVHVRMYWMGWLPMAFTFARISGLSSTSRTVSSFGNTATLPLAAFMITHRWSVTFWALSGCWGGCARNPGLLESRPDEPTEVFEWTWLEHYSSLFPDLPRKTRSIGYGLS
jgi:hypothetical protein